MYEQKYGQGYNGYNDHNYVEIQSITSKSTILLHIISMEWKMKYGNKNRAQLKKNLRNNPCYEINCFGNNNHCR